MTKPIIAILGAGNIGQSIARGLLESKAFQAEQLILTKRRIGQLADFKALGVRILDNNPQAVSAADIIILAFKPHKIKAVLTEIDPYLKEDRHVLVSVATGVFLHEIRDILSDEVAVFRAMPNTAIAVRESMTCICGENANGGQEQMIIDLFNQLGIAIKIEEEHMDAATVLAACGIAYALRFVRANMQGGIEIGFDATDALNIASQTVKGAAALLIEGHQHPEDEIDKVTTPQGCTIAGLNEMEHRGFSSSLIKGIAASFQKIRSS